MPGGSELDDVLAGLDVAGIEILEEPKDFEKKLEEAEELIDLELPAGVGEKINDPVRMYLREMGTVPLLTREGEVEIARRIERGQNTVLKSLSRAPLVIQEIIAHGRGDVAASTLSARDIIQIADPMLTDEMVEEKRQEFARCTEEIGRQYKQDPAVPPEAAGHPARHEAETVPPAALGAGAADGADLAAGAARSSSSRP